MRARTSTRVSVATLISALFISASPAQGYTNPIENQSTETVTNTWNLGSDILYVGSNTWGNSMVVSNSGFVVNADGYVGFRSGAYSNLVEVVGAGSVWSNTGWLVVGYYGSDNALSITNGASVQSVYGDVGSENGADNNTVMVNGTGSAWIDSATIAVGWAGSGNTLIITNGGSVQDVFDSYVGGTANGGSNSIVIAGPGSVWSNASRIFVGDSGIGNELSITTGGHVYNTDAYIGRVGGADNNRVMVSGSNSVWESSGNYLLGVAGDGNALTITNGGYAKSVTGYIGYFAEATGNVVTVSGSNSVWETSNVNFGISGSDNQLSISAGGRVNSGAGRIGMESSATRNTARVSGTNSVWDAGETFLVGNEGHDNHLIVEYGGHVNSDSANVGYGGGGASNTVSVYGTGSVWQIAVDLYMGARSSDNLMSITNGGQVNSESATIGQFSGSDRNRVVVEAAGSVWNNSGSLTVGGSGSWNMLTITNGGHVENTFAYLGLSSASTNNRVVATGAQSSWSCTDNLYLGRWGGNGNVVDILAGAVVSSVGGSIGYDPAATGNRVSVSGYGSIWTNTGWLYVGEEGSGNVMHVLDGGQVQGSGATIGHDSSAGHNQVVVYGMNSLWNNNGFLLVGNTGFGNSMQITGGAEVQSLVGILGNSSVSFSNRVEVTGAGSVWSNSMWFAVGALGDANALVITNGGRVYNADGEIARSSLATGNMVTVSGGGSLWNNTGGLYVGGLSSGAGGSGNALAISEGGVVAAQPGTIYSNNTVHLESGGILTLGTTFTCQTNATLEMGLNSATSYGQLSVGGPAVLAGTLDVMLLGGFMPSTGDVFNLFSWGGGISNSFETVNLPALSGGLTWNTNDLYTGGTLSVNFGGVVDTDGDGLPDWWELAYFSNPTNADSGAVCSNGLNKLMEAYIAGLDPTNSGSYFRITNAWQDVSGFVVEWDPSVSGRWYSVNWTNDLTGGFTSIVDNIDFPQNSYTDTAHNAEDTGFYQMEVQMK